MNFTSHLRHFILLSITLLSVITLSAQTGTDWPEAGKFRLDTLKSRTNVNTLFIAAGGFFKGSINDNIKEKSTTDYGIFVYGRYRIGKIATVSAYINQGLLDMANGGGSTSQQDFRASLYFLKSIVMAEGIKVLEQYSDSKTIAKYNYPTGSFYGITASLINKKYFNPVSTNTGTFTNTTTSAIIPNATGVVQVNSQILSLGFTNTMTSKFKGRIKYTNSKNRHEAYTIRQNGSTDIYFEGLMALNTNISSNVFSANNSDAPTDISTVKYSNTNLSRFGYRVLLVTQIKNIFSLNAQIASIPGIRDLTEKSYLNNFQFQVGFGIAIGAL